MSQTYQFTSQADWRKTVKSNQHKTYMVIMTFVILFLLLGILMDLIFRLNFDTGGAVYHANGGYYAPSPSLGDIATKLITFQLIPWATIISTAIAIIWVLCTFAFHNKIMLAGTKYRQVTQDSNDPLEKQIYNLVEEMKIAANMHYMPRVYLINADYMNAFASGYSEKSAMIAVTTRLAETLNRSELQAVIAHELTHIRNQDIKLNLFTVVLANMLVFMMEISFFSVLFSGSGRRDNKSNNNAAAILLIVVLILRYVLPIITSLLMLFLSRTREYMADAGAVELMRDNQPMANALIKISDNHQQPEAKQAYAQQSNEAMRHASYLYEPPKAVSNKSNLNDLFSTHPSLAKRLAAIGIKGLSENKLND